MNYSKNECTRPVWRKSKTLSKKAFKRPDYMERFTIFL